MGTRGVKAYLYKKRYYRTYIPGSSHPDIFGDKFASQIPREETQRLAWISSLIERIEQEVRWRNKHGVPDKESIDLEYKYSDDDDGFTTLHEGRIVIFQDIQGMDCGMAQTMITTPNGHM
ncbi:hypothetical protein FRC12_005826 [Ceratobasidium sp. 428]|nr:hypothetical protein FRC12_005826 [Ceratobasidium sp. 428]